jgi:hypothetical protein
MPSPRTITAIVRTVDAVREMAIRRATRFQLTYAGSGIEERSVTLRAYYACYRIGVENRDYH